MLVKIVKGPCKGCEKRHVGCHSECDEYLSYKDEIKKVKANALEVRRLDYHPWRDIR